MIARKPFSAWLCIAIFSAIAWSVPALKSDEPARSDNAKVKESPKFAGRWTGKVAGQLDVFFELKPGKEKDSPWIGSFDVPAQAVKGFELDKIVIKDDTIKFGLKGVPGDAHFEGKLNGDGKSITGKFYQGPAELELILTSAPKPDSEEMQSKKPEPGSQPKVAKADKVSEAEGKLEPGLNGSWRGKVGGQLEIIFKLKEPEKEGALWSGTFDVPMQNVKDFALDKIEVKGDKITFSLGGVPGDARYEGTVSEKGGMISGRYKQGPIDVEMELKKDRVKTTAIDTKSIDEIAKKLLEDWKAPGLALAVVKDGKVLHAAGYGFKNVEKKEPMTADTLLAIGSCTKAFTTATIAALVEQGLLDWDRPVNQYWPEFRIVDPATTQFVTLRDLVSHRTGLPRHDLMWFAGEITRADILKRLEHLQPAAPIRQKWIYNNIMYVAAAAAAERATGKSWEELVRQSLLEPLDMKRTNFHIKELTSDADHATGYHDKGESKDGFKAKPYREIAGMSPAGSINSSANEMAKWAIFHLGHGPKKADGNEILRKSSITELHKPVMLTGSSGSDRNDVHELGYGLGWGSESDRGKRVVRHGGAIDGFVALVTLYPDDDLGIVALVNQSGSGLPGIVSRTVGDSILNRSDVNWSAHALAKIAAVEAQEKAVKTDKAKARIADTKPSHPLKDYAGTFENPVFGKLVVTQEGEGLKIAYGIVPIPLKHWHYDVFAADTVKPEDDAFEDKLFTFVVNTDGSIGSITSDFEPMIAPVVFKRIADARTSDPKFLDTLAGEYELSTQVLKIERNGTTLQAVLHGQPVYKLKPTQGLTFDFDGMPGFRIRFDLDDANKVTGLSIEQPNGTFLGKPKSK